MEAFQIKKSRFSVDRKWRSRLNISSSRPGSEDKADCKHKQRRSELASFDTGAEKIRKLILMQGKFSGKNVGTALCWGERAVAYGMLTR